jgi:hypothetical protein
VLPVRVRTAGSGRPALVTGVFLLVASLALSVSPVSPDARSISPTSRSFIHVTATPGRGGMRLAGHDHDGRLVRLENLLAAATPERPRASAEVQIRTFEGLERWLRCNHSLLYEGGEWTTDVVIVHDVTRIRQAERADHLARLVEDLLLASWISSEPVGTAVVGMQRECTDLAKAARRAASAPWRGAAFTVRLPLGPWPRRRRGQRRRRPRPGRRHPAARTRARRLHDSLCRCS